MSSTSIRPISPQSPQLAASPRIPEAAGPVTEDGTGAAYPAVQVPRVVIPPRERQDPADLPASCARCDGVPHEVTAPLQAVMRRAGPAEPGCWRCPAIPADVLQPPRPPRPKPQGGPPRPTRTPP